MYIYLIIHSFWCFCEKEIVSNKYVDHTNNFLILFKKKKNKPNSISPCWSLQLYQRFSFDTHPCMCEKMSRVNIQFIILHM